MPAVNDNTYGANDSIYALWGAGTLNRRWLDWVNGKED